MIICGIVITIIGVVMIATCYLMGFDMNWRPGNGEGMGLMLVILGIILIGVGLCGIEVSIQ